VVSGQQIAGQQYFTDPNNWRRIGHIISDAVYTKITGVGGFFDTRIVFVDESGPKENRRKRLAIMDQDGGNVRYLTQGDNMVVTPRYSPVSLVHHLHVASQGQQPRGMSSTSRRAPGQVRSATSPTWTSPRRALARRGSASS
jgi:TolB protein